MPIRIIKNRIGIKELQEVARKEFGDVVKAVVDVEQAILAVGGDLHADEEMKLMENHGSKREHTWGVNLYPMKSGEEFIEFDSMINLKPSFGNRTRNVENPEVREKIRKIVHELVAD